MEQTQRQKLELFIGKPVTLEILYDQPLLGENRYGPYYLYALSDDNGNEFSFFAPNAQTHMELSQFKAGDRVTLLKSAKQNGKKVVTDISVMPAVMPTSAAPPTNGNGRNGTVPKTPVNGNGKAVSASPTPTVHDAFFQILESCYADAIKLQERFNGMVDVNRLAITLFIARSKINGYNGVAS
ncbi:MAG: hypothetical protein IH600_05720 [Bacteroidetes bacterium]|nr:hypothetical protein [Bacteroidota bacterium]